MSLNKYTQSSEMIDLDSNRKVLYHYTSADSFFSILQKMQLKISRYQKANDLAETEKFLGVEPFISVVSSKFIRERCGYISFSRNYNWQQEGKKYRMEGWTIPTMWAYYANCNKGVCIKIDERKFINNNKDTLSKYWLQNVKYKRFVHNKVYEVTTKMSPEEIITHYHNEIFFQKQKSWSHEQEKRLCMVDPPEYLSIKDCVLGVAFGSRFETTDMLKVISMVEDTSFECYKQFSQLDFYSQSNLNGIPSIDNIASFIKIDEICDRVNSFLIE